MHLPQLAHRVTPPAAPKLTLFGIHFLAHPQPFPHHLLLPPIPFLSFSLQQDPPPHPEDSATSVLMPSPFWTPSHWMHTVDNTLT